jgi:hypothetical protein
MDLTIADLSLYGLQSEVGLSRSVLSDRRVTILRALMGGKNYRHIHVFSGCPCKSG